MAELAEVVFAAVAAVVASMVVFGLLFGALHVTASTAIRLAHIVAFGLFVAYLLLYSPYQPLLEDWQYFVLAVAVIVVLLILTIRPRVARKAS